MFMLRRFKVWVFHEAINTAVELEWDRMFYFLFGYCLAVFVPVPWLNSGIIGLWRRLGTELELWVKGRVNTAPATGHQRRESVI